MKQHHTGRSGFSSSFGFNKLGTLPAAVLSSSFDVGLYNFEPGLSVDSSPCYITQTDSNNIDNHYIEIAASSQIFHCKQQLKLSFKGKVETW